MAWPTNKPDSNKFSSDESSIKESRPELNTMSQAVNDIVDYVDTAAEANGYILEFNSGTGKLEYVPNTNAIDINGGAGITVDQESTGGFNIDFSGSYTTGYTTYDFNQNDLSITSTGTQPRIQSNNATYAGLLLRTEATYLGQISLIGGNNANIEIAPHGTGKILMGNGSNQAVITTSAASAQNLKLETANGINSGTILINQGTNGNIEISPDGTGKVQFHGAYSFPTSDGSTGQVLQTNGAGQLSFATVSGGGGGTTEITAGDNITVSQPDSAGAFEIGFSNPLTNPINVNNQSINDAVFKGYSELVYTGLSTSGTLTPDVSNGNVQVVTLSGNITINSLSSVANGDSVTIIIKQPGSGGPYTLSSTMKFAGGTKTLSTGANEIDVLSIFYDGTDYLASLSTNFS